MSSIGYKQPYNLDNILDGSAFGVWKDDAFFKYPMKLADYEPPRIFEVNGLKHADNGKLLESSDQIVE